MEKDKLRDVIRDSHQDTRLQNKMPLVGKRLL